jgi:site-specific DNA-methyltransferase (adenine-specific)
MARPATQSGGTVKPYYDDGQITIYHADCRDILPLLPEGSVDLVIADPPYGETSLDWDAVVGEWMPLAQRILKPSGSLWVFGSMRSFLADAEAFRSWKFVQDVVWEKHNGSGMNNDRFRRVHEHVLQFHLRSSRWSDVYKCPRFTMDATKRTVRRKALPPQWQGARGPTHYSSEDGGPRLMRSVLSVRSEHGRAIHPTQKPPGIILPLIEYSCPPDGIVVDPFAGSGTTLRVAKNVGRRAIGVDNKEEYCEMMARRLQQAVLPLSVL